MCAQFGGARKIENGIRTLLIELEISDENSPSTFFPPVRDRSDIAVMQARRAQSANKTGKERPALA